MTLANMFTMRNEILVRLGLAAMLALGIAVLSAQSAGASGPTCENFAGLGWANHGQHITEDYVFAGEEPGVRGAPGVHQHGGGAFQPGASFCVEQAQSPTGANFPGKGTGPKN